MLTRVQCPCGFVASAQSVRAASYALETHGGRPDAPKECQWTRAVLVDRKP